MMSRRFHLSPCLAGALALGFLLAASSAPARGMTTALPQVGVSAAQAFLGQHTDPARYMEDTPDEIYRENRANPLQAWALAFFPALLVKGVTVSLAFVLAESNAWAAYLPLVPAMGHSHFWETKVWWAGAIALGGDLVGSSLLAYYFSELNRSTPTTRPEKTMLYAGISIMVVFFLYENISAPIVAAWHNRRLRENFKPASDEDSRAASGSAWRFAPWPDMGIAQIGPTLRLDMPVGASYAFQF